jgi:AmmeMemoRadiSam system protein B
MSVADFPLPARPRLRRLTLIPMRDEGMFLVHDPQEYVEAFGLSTQLAPILKFCDGRHEPEDIRRSVAREFGVEYSLADVRRALERMDRWLLFDSPRFAAHREGVEDAFLRSAVRPAAHAGASYPAERTALRARLDAILALPSPASRRRPETLVGVVAPHIDLRVGERAYAPVYQAVRRFAETLPEDAELTILVLGTAHYGGGLFVASRKDYETPLGVMRCDREFLADLETNFGDSLTAADGNHRREHSIEFQVVFLQRVFGERVARGRVKLAPVLCGSFHSLLETVHESGRDRGEYRRFIDALRRTLARRKTKTLSLVGGDLAHVGRKFGDPFDAETALSRVEREDAELLEIVRRRDAAGLLRHIARDRDARNVCGFPPMLAFLDTLDACGGAAIEGDILHYEQWNERETRSAVTYAGLAFHGE